MSTDNSTPTSGPNAHLEQEPILHRQRNEAQRLDINGALAPLRQEIADLRNQLAGMNQKYEEVLYRLETNELAAQEMTPQEMTA